MLPAVNMVVKTAVRSFSSVSALALAPRRIVMVGGTPDGGAKVVVAAGGGTMLRSQPRVLLTAAKTSGMYSGVHV